MPGSDLSKTPVSVSNIKNGLLPEIDARIEKRVAEIAVDPSKIVNIKISKRILSARTSNGGWGLGDVVELETTVRLVRNVLQKITVFPLLGEIEKFQKGEGYALNEQGQAVIPEEPQNTSVIIKSKLTIPLDISYMGSTISAESVIIGTTQVDSATVDVAVQADINPEIIPTLSVEQWRTYGNLAAVHPEYFARWTTMKQPFKINFTGVGEVPMQVVAIGQYDITGGTGKCGFVIQPMCIPFKHKMNETSTSKDGYAASYMFKQQSTLLTTYFPEEWQNLIETVQIPYTKTETADAVMMSAKLFPASEMEVFGVSANSRKPAGTQFAYWAEHNTNQDRILKDNLGEGTAQYWWLRDVSSSTYFVSVNTSGAVNHGNASNEFGAPLCFCIGKSE